MTKRFLPGRQKTNHRHRDCAGDKPGGGNARYNSWKGNYFCGYSEQDIDEPETEQ